METSFAMECVTHDFEVANFAQLEGMGVGRFITSTTFSAGGYDWNIRYYPDGSEHYDAGKASAYLCYLSQADDVRTKFTLTTPEGYEINPGRVCEHVFSPDKDTMGFSDFVQKSRLRLLSSAHLTLRCVLVVINEPPPPPPTEQRNLPTGRGGVPPPRLLNRDLAAALENGKGADVTVLVGGTEFMAHRFMLAARSPVFDGQLFGPMMDKDTQHIVVHDMEPAIFEMLLHFIYTDSLPPSIEEKHADIPTVQHLLVAADRYGMDRLKAMCEKKLCKSIGVKTVTITLALADEHYCEELKKACLEFMSTPGVAAIVSLTDGFKRLMAPRTPPVLEEENPEDKQEVPVERKKLL